jgi:hypothetical protein
MNNNSQIKSNQEQLFDCLTQLALRAQELKETNVAIVLMTLCGSMKGDEMSLPMLASVCQSFSTMELERITDILKEMGEEDWGN